MSDSPETWSSVWRAAETVGHWSGFPSRWNVSSGGSCASLAGVWRKWAGTWAELVFVEEREVKEKRRNSLTGGFH